MGDQLSARRTAASEIIVATTRPETMLGDTAVAVHPDDERYKHLDRQEVELPLTGRQIPIIADGARRPRVRHRRGQGHAGARFNDYEVGAAPQAADAISIIDVDGQDERARAGEVSSGMTVAEARKAVVADLEAAGLLGEIEAAQGAARPQPALRRRDRADAVDAVVGQGRAARRAGDRRGRDEGKTKFVPEPWTKTYMHWMTNIRDWCISRQLWWGHRIPAWYCDATRHVTVAAHDPTACATCGVDALKQDEDVLDTWFSSALWPFSTLGWPEKTRELKTFYPTTCSSPAPTSSSSGSPA